VRVTVRDGELLVDVQAAAPAQLPAPVPADPV
jgi:hypothetical protein